jgi:proteasome alpha subunit
MSMPFYVSPEQLMQDRAEFARKGIARGKSIVALECAGGLLLMAENVSTSLSKIGEIYDRIAFAGVGRFSEFDELRRVGVRAADMKGFSFCREDVSARWLANQYSQYIGEVFTRDLKPKEVEILVAEVGDDRFEGHEVSSIYRVQYDGTITDHAGFCVIGGIVDEVQSSLQSNYRASLPLGDAVSLGRQALGRAANGDSVLTPDNLEVGLLDRERAGRKFRRLPADELQSILGS